jgi:ribonuclease BN (tRNA processing enzyme)
MRDKGVAVTCALVDHPPVRPAFAYRLDSPDRSIVISGDTKRTGALIKLARGAGVLVHEAMWPAAIERLMTGLYNGEALKKSVLGHHTAAEEVALVATQAEVETLVLSHFVPAEDPEV